MQIKELKTNEQKLINKIRNHKNPTQALIIATAIICSVLKEEKQRANDSFAEDKNL